MIFTDRSRQETGLQVCLRRRYWEYHSVNGFGIRPKQRSIPLATGIHIHLGLALILKAIMLGGQEKLPSLKDPIVREQMRAAIEAAIGAYHADVEAVGFLNEPREELQRVVDEQAALIEGAVWGWIRTSLLMFLQQFLILAVEQEESIVVGCSCGIGDRKGEWEHHYAKGCEGVCQQAKPDIVCEDRNSREVGIHDFKSMKYINDYEVERYKNSVQMAVGTLTVERRLGRPVTHYYVWAILKGDRKAEYNPVTRAFDRPKIQLSGYCYVGWTPANPPLKPETFDWEAKWYKRLPTWTLPLETKPEEMRQIEYLVMELMPIETLQKQFTKIGPYAKQHFLMGYLRQVKYDEERWVEVQWRIYEDVEAGATIEEALDRWVPASWNCRKFGDLCPFWAICAGEGATAKDPLRSDLYTLRVPHHEPEMIAAVSAGVEFPENAVEQREE